MIIEDFSEGDIGFSFFFFLFFFLNAAIIVYLPFFPARFSGRYRLRDLLLVLLVLWLRWQLSILFYLPTQDFLQLASRLEDNI